MALPHLKLVFLRYFDTLSSLSYGKKILEIASVDGVDAAEIVSVVTSLRVAAPEGRRYFLAALPFLAPA